MGGDVSGGRFPLTGDLTVTRMGFGAMRLAGTGVWGPPRDRGAAIRVLREVAGLGLTHIDTAGFYGPDVVNDLIREALHPYPDALHIVTKVGYRRTRDRSWRPALSREDLTAAVHGNLRHLGLEALDVVNLRVGAGGRPVPGPVAEPFGVLADLQSQGLIRYLGVSNVTLDQLAEARTVARVVCVQNRYNLADRQDDPLLDRCAADGVAFVPFFPLGTFSPVQASVLDGVAARLGASPPQVALAWLLHRSPNILLIPGTSAEAHLRENVTAATLNLPVDARAALNASGSHPAGSGRPLDLERPF
jgi:aryl-alcohol dehydrogenase-like predicted oxidoreductase